MSLSQEILDRARAADERLRASPFYGRLLTGDVDRDEYAAWLVQVHKYVRHTTRGERGLASSLTEAAAHDQRAAKIRAYALHEAKEEEGHDDLLLLDLAALWDVTPEAALGRIEREPSAPATVAWNGVVDVMLSRFAEGVVGVALALETIASLHTDEIRRGLLGSGTIPGIEGAVAFLSAHSGEVETGHLAAGRRRGDLLADPQARSAAFFYANAALAMYEGIVHHLDARFAVAFA